MPYGFSSPLLVGVLFCVHNLQDQEVLEVRRARDEKDDRLRDALASVAALQGELQFLKRLRFHSISPDSLEM